MTGESDACNLKEEANWEDELEKCLVIYKVDAN